MTAESDCLASSVKNMACPVFYERSHFDLRVELKQNNYLITLPILVQLEEN